MGISPLKSDLLAICVDSSKQGTFFFSRGSLITVIILMCDRGASDMYLHVLLDTFALSLSLCPSVPLF